MVAHRDTSANCSGIQLFTATNTFSDSACTLVLVWAQSGRPAMKLLTAVDVSRSACQRRVFRRAVNCLCLCTGCRPGTGAYCPGERQASACRWQIEATQGNFLRGCEENTVIPGPRTDMADRHFPGNRPISDKSGACPDRLVEQPSPSVPVNSAVRAVLSSWS